MRRTVRRLVRVLRPVSPDVRPVPADGVIREPGRYRLDGDVAATGRAGIEINADGVALDLGGHRVQGIPGSFHRRTFGIMARHARDLAIRNGAVVGGWTGIDLFKARDVTVEGVELAGFGHTGIVANDVRRLRVAGCRIGVEVQDVHRPQGEAYAIGVNAMGEGIVVADCDIALRDPRPHGQPVEIIGLLIGAGSGAEVAGCRIAAEPALSASYGIWGGAGCRIRAAGNRIANVEYGMAVADGATASVEDSSFACECAPARAGRGLCTAAIFARSATLAEGGNRVAGYASAVTHYRPDDPGPVQPREQSP